MAEPIVHIGFPKTASTWFQRSFYPHVRSPRYVDRDRVNAAFLEGNALEFDAERARATLGLAAGEAGILCEEGLCGYLHNGGVDGHVARGVAEQISQALPDARIVIMIRAQPRIIVSAYQQYVRAGGTYPARRYLFPQDYLIGPNAVTYKQPRFSLDFFAYSHLIECYEQLFGQDKVHVFLFEEFQKGGLDFMRRFADRLSLEVDWPAISLAPRLASYSTALAYLARFFNLFTARSVLDKRHLIHLPGWYWLRRRILEALNRSRLFGKSPDLDQLVGAPAARWIANYFVADNQRLVERRLLPLAEHGYPLVNLADAERPRIGEWRRRLVP
jgi:hypothetical protein